MGHEHAVSIAVIAYRVPLLPTAYSRAMIAKKDTADARWEQTSTNVRPKDGDKAEVRLQPDRNRLVAIFIYIYRAHPIPRWESLDGTHVYEFRFFEQWRRI